MKPLAFFIFLILNIMPVLAQSNKIVSIQWDSIANIPAGKNQVKSIGVAGPIVGVLQNKLIVAGGANFPEKMPWLGGKKFYYNDLFVFEKNKNKVSVTFKKIQLPDNIAYSASCVTPLGIVYAGGENELGLSDKVNIIKWDKESNTITITNLPHLPESLTNASLACIDNTIYLMGGETVSNTTNQFISLDLEHLDHGWNQFPNMPKPLSNLVSVAHFSNDYKQLFIIGGRAKQKNGISIFSSDVYCFDLETKKWHIKQALPYAISAGTGTLFAEKYILLFGGDKGDRFNKVESQISKINAATDTVIKNSLIQIKNNLLESHPGFSREILLYNIQTNQWITNGTIPFTTSVTTNTVQWNDEVIIPSGEIKAGVRTPRIIAAKITIHE